MPEIRLLVAPEGNSLGEVGSLLAVTKTVSRDPAPDRPNPAYGGAYAYGKTGAGSRSVTPCWMAGGEFFNGDYERVLTRLCEVT